MFFHNKKTKLKKIGITLLWLLPIFFFSMVAFGGFNNLGLNEDESILQRIVPFAFIIGTLILAWVISKKHYPKVKDQIGKLRTLVFIPLVTIYAILIEMSFNYHHWQTPGRMMEHLNHHIFEDTHIFLLISVIMWLIFRKVEVGKWTFLAAYGLGVFFQWFFADGDGEGPRSIIFGLLWVWVFYVTWYITCLLLRPKKLLTP